MTLFENRVLGLASASGGRRLACKAFIELVLQAASQAQALDDLEGGAHVLEEGADEEWLSFERWVETLTLMIRGLSFRVAASSDRIAICRVSPHPRSGLNS